MDPRWLDAGLVLQFYEILVWLMVCAVALIFVVELACLLVLWLEGPGTVGPPSPENRKRRESPAC
jgi:hypothetical protein